MQASNTGHRRNRGGRTKFFTREDQAYDSWSAYVAPNPLCKGPLSWPVSFARADHRIGHQHPTNLRSTAPLHPSLSALSATSLATSCHFRLAHALAVPPVAQSGPPKSPRVPSRSSVSTESTFVGSCWCCRFFALPLRLSRFLICSSFGRRCIGYASRPPLSHPAWSIFGGDPSGLYAFPPFALLLLFIGNFLGEELYFRGYLMKKSSFLGRANWFINPFLFALYHLWQIPMTWPWSASSSRLVC